MKSQPTVVPVKKAKAFFAAQPKTVLTFVGFSGAGYEDPAALRSLVERILEAYPAESTLVNIGVTPDGIGKAYEWARDRGYETAGIVSSQALAYEASSSPFVDHAFFIEDAAWGGYVEGTRKLSPTSEAMVSVSDVMVAIGGGAVACDELTEMVKRNKPIWFYPAEMNRSKAVGKAKKRGLPEPTDFWGEADPVFRTSADRG